MTLSKYADELYAPAYPGRWNSKGVQVMYCSWSRSLASLEHLVHRGDKVLSPVFSIMVIEIDDSAQMSSITLDSLDQNWSNSSIESYRYCQGLGDQWAARLDSCLLEIPSAVIPAESNYMINPKHEDFKLVRLIRREEFRFDKRIYS